MKCKVVEIVKNNLGDNVTGKPSRKSEQAPDWTIDMRNVSNEKEI